MTGFDILLEGRALAEARMTDTWKVTRDNDEPVLDTETGTYVPSTATIYEGPGRLKLSSSVVSEVDAQGQLLAQQGPRLDLPVDTSADVLTGDLAECIASTHDASMVGHVVTIKGIFLQTDATARRFPVEVQS